MTDQHGDANPQNGGKGAEEKEFKPFTEADVTTAFEAGDMDKLKEIAEWGAKSTPGLYRRAKDAESELEKRDKKPDGEAEPKKPQVKPSDNDDDPAKHPDYQDLRFDGYTKEEAEYIIRNGGRKALTDGSFVKAGIDKIREDADKKKKSEDATPSGSGRSPVYKKYTEAELKGMSSKELEKILPTSE